MKKFVKYNKGKLDFTLLDPGVIEGLADISGHGAGKYSRDNWKKVFAENPFYGVEVYTQAFFRHALKMLAEEIDQESGRPHRWCAAWNLMAVEYGYRLVEKLPKSSHKRLISDAQKRLQKEAKEMFDKEKRSRRTKGKTK